MRTETLRRRWWKPAFPTREVQPGEWVLVHKDRLLGHHFNKLQAPWLEPFLVLEIQAHALRKNSKRTINKASDLCLATSNAVPLQEWLPNWNRISGFSFNREYDDDAYESQRRKNQTVQTRDATEWMTRSAARLGARWMKKSK